MRVGRHFGGPHAYMGHYPSLLLRGDVPAVVGRLRADCRYRCAMAWAMRASAVQISLWARTKSAYSLR